MKKDPIQDRFEDTAQDLREYTQLQLDGIKLRLLEKLSTLFNNVLSTFILVILGSITLMSIGLVLVLVFAELTGSLLAGAAITTGILLLIMLIVYARRRKMFINSMVRMLTKMLFEKEKEE
ncbi:MAG: hypothetical protein LUD68_02740 [Rikenellaceae bacterium]|nr:hypothetical protein [Rikenellaceae bacterium]